MEEGIGLIVNVKQFGNISAILTIYNIDGKIINGIVKNVYDISKSGGLYQAGNLVQYKHFKKEKSLGILDCEAEKLYACVYFDNKLSINLINMMIFIMHNFIQDCDSVHQSVLLYINFANNMIKSHNNAQLITEYISTEIQMLKLTGLYQKQIDCKNDINTIFANNTKIIFNICNQMNCQKNVNVISKLRQEIQNVL